jgi:hypothetical protein
MKHFLLSISFVSVLAACGSKPVANTDEPIRNQKLSTSFTEEKIKIETDCAWYKFWKSNCQIVAIESTGVAWTNGASSVQVSEARKVARMEASANVAHFLNERITSSRVTNVVAKHIEKARDIYESTGSGESSMTDKEAARSTKGLRENSNDTARTVTRTIRANAETILRGFQTIKEERVGPQEIAVTIRWDRKTDATTNQIYKHFNR